MISELLYTGRHRPRSGAELAAILHCNVRVVSRAVERERRAGIPICATTDGVNPGYYLAESQEDITLYCDSLQHRAGELHKTRAAVLQAGKKLPEKPPGAI